MVWIQNQAINLPSSWWKLLNKCLFLLFLNFIVSRQFIFGYNIVILIFKLGNKCLSQFPYQTYLTIALHEWSCYSVNPWMICLKSLILVIKTNKDWGMELYGVFWFILVINNFSFKYDSEMPDTSNFAVKMWNSVKRSFVKNFIVL